MKLCFMAQIHYSNCNTAKASIRQFQVDDDIGTYFRVTTEVFMDVWKLNQSDTSFVHFRSHKPYYYRYIYCFSGAIINK